MNAQDRADRRYFGDHPIGNIDLSPMKLSDDEVIRISSLFPEADIRPLAGQVPLIDKSQLY